MVAADLKQTGLQRHIKTIHGADHEGEDVNPKFLERSRALFAAAWRFVRTVPNVQIVSVEPDAIEVTRAAA